MMFRFLLLLAWLPLTACAGLPFDLQADRAPAIATTTMAVPMVETPPDAGRVLAVREERSRDAIWQKITLEGDADTMGENAVDVTRGGIAPRRPTDADIARELAARFPTGAVRMGALASNVHGPFGHAFARMVDQNCLYAWQWIDDAGGSDRWFGTPQPVSLRLRLCRAKASDEALVSIMRRLVVPGAPVTDALAAFTLDQPAPSTAESPARFSSTGVVARKPSKRATMLAPRDVHLDDAFPIPGALRPHHDRDIPIGDFPVPNSKG